MLKEILTMPTEHLGKVSRFVVFQIRLWWHCGRLLKKNRAGQQAAALSYRTIFGLVPLAIVILLIFQLFPTYTTIGDKVKNLVYDGLRLSNIKYPAGDAEDPEKTVMLTEYLDKVVGDFFRDIDKGAITIVSVVLIIWAALGLLTTIEGAFNSIWGVGKGRRFLQRIINYWAILTLGPLLFGAGIYIATQYSAIGQLRATVLSNVTPAVLSYVITTVALFLLYFLLPNVQVQTKSAVWGAAVAAFAWSIAKWGFGMYVTKFIPYNQIYGVMGLVPLGVFWIFITWLIVLFGLQLTFTTQHLASLDAAEIAAARKREEYFIANDVTVINIVREIAAAFESGRAPVESEVVLSRLNMPAEFGEKILRHLVACGILAKSSEPKVGFIPAKDPAHIKLSDIAEAVASAGFAQSASRQPDSLSQIDKSQRNALAQYNLKQILDSGQKS